MKEKTRKLAGLLPWLMLAGVFMMTVVFFSLNARHNMDTDVAGEMMLANLCNEEHVLSLTTKWNYTSELRIVGSTMFWKLGLRLFPNDWMAAHAFGFVLFMGLYLASVLFAAIQCGFKKTAPWFAMILMLPFSEQYGYIVIYGMSYAMHMVMSFTALGLIAMYARKHDRLNTLAKGLILAVLAVLGAWGGANGVRMLTMVYGPMAMAALALCLLRFAKVERLRDGFREPFFRVLIASMAAAVGSLGGYVYFDRVLTPMFPGQSYFWLRIQGFGLDGLIDQFNRLFGFFGYYGLETFFSFHGIGCYIVILLFACLVAAVVWCVAHMDRLPTLMCFILLTAIAGVAVGMVLNITLEMLYPRYFMFGILLTILCVFIFFEVQPYRCKPIFYAMLFIFVGLFGYKSLEYIRGEMHTGRTNYEMAADWLMENGYTKGYVSFWNSNPLTLASNGEIETWNLKYIPNEPDAEPEFWKQLQLASHLTERPEGRIFLLLDEDENNMNWGPIDEAHLVGEDIGGAYYVYEYESADEMYDMIHNAPHTEATSETEEN